MNHRADFPHRPLALCAAVIGAMGMLVAASTAEAGVRTRSSARPSINGGSHASGNRNANVNVNRNSNRNTNVNVNRNVDINVDADRGWDNGYHHHPVATAVEVTAAVAVTSAVIGSIVNTVPSTGCVTTVINGLAYQNCGSTWYQPQYAGTNVTYVVVAPPR